MLESLNLDWRGETHVDFDDMHLLFVRRGYARVRARRHAKGRTILTNAPLRYLDIRWIGVFRLRRWWMLIPGIPFALLGCLGMAVCWGDWFGVGFYAVVCFLLGVVPLLLW